MEGLCGRGMKRCYLEHKDAAERRSRRVAELEEQAENSATTLAGFQSAIQRQDERLAEAYSTIKTMQNLRMDDHHKIVQYLLLTVRPFL